jgi:hypothetical protein
MLAEEIAGDSGFELKGRMGYIGEKEGGIENVTKNQNCSYLTTMSWTKTVEPCAN